MPEFLTRKDVMDALKVSADSVDRLIRLGQVSGGKDGLWPVIKIGRNVRISKEAVLKFVKKSELMKV